MNAAIERQLKQLKQQTKKGSDFHHAFRIILKCFVYAACNGVTCLSYINAVRKNCPRI